MLALVGSTDTRHTLSHSQTHMAKIGENGTVTLTLGVELMCYHSPMHTVSYHRHRFPAEVIQHAVWLYFRFPLSFRESRICWPNVAWMSPMKLFAAGP